MTAVVLIAVMVDRRAVTFRTLAVAAMIVLSIAPELGASELPDVVRGNAGAGGAGADRHAPAAGRARQFSHRAGGYGAGGRSRCWRWLSGGGLATMPYAAFHFHRVTPYGVLANLAAMPVVSALVMPAGLLGLAAMPFGFDGVFWRIMGGGIDWMIAVAQWVAALPGAIGRIGAFGTGPLIAASLGIILLGLLRTPLRWGGAAALVLAVAWALAAPQPDILISADGHTVGVRGREGRLHLIRTTKDAFLLREWLAADADGRQAVDPSLGEGVSCDQAGCVAQMADGGLVALAQRPEALGDDCERAALLVTTRQVAPGCGALVVDQDRLRRQGAMALRRSRDGFAVDAVRPKGADRPWSPAVAGIPRAQPT